MILCQLPNKDRGQAGSAVAESSHSKSSERSMGPRNASKFQKNFPRDPTLNQGPS